MRVCEKLVIISAPSGSGKGTIISHLLERLPRLEFSISATSRAPRNYEKHGVEYYFLSPEEFASRAAAGHFVEWEEVYQGASYGTLHSEIERIWQKGNVIIFDLDVKGGLNMKNIFGDKAISIFIMPPSVEELRRRLVNRSTETAEQIDKRIAKAELEISHAPEFDAIVVNDDLMKAVGETEAIIREFIER